MSFWRFIHFCLAILISVFLIIASVTGAILSFDNSIAERHLPQVQTFNGQNVSLLVKNLCQRYDQILEIKINPNQTIELNAIDADFNEVKGYANLQGDIIAPIKKKSDLIQWTTTLHRSLFLHDIGRFLMGLCSFLLTIVVISGLGIILKQQKFFAKVKNPEKISFYHTFLGRFSLSPILIVALSGAFLWANRFFLPEEISSISINYELIEAENKINFEDFPIFLSTDIKEVSQMIFPFSFEEPFILKLKDREIHLDPSNGNILNEKEASIFKKIQNLSLDLHTGQAHWLWALVLFFTCVALLFFIYSGIFISIKRFKVKVKNPYSVKEAEIVILYGSENGSTLHFANKVHCQLLEKQYKSLLLPLNDYQMFESVKRIIVFSATYGLGEAPANANQFLKKLKQTPQNHFVECFVVGFGSRMYLNFCRFANDIYEEIKQTSWAIIGQNIFLVNNKSEKEFSLWIKYFNVKTDFSLEENAIFYQSKTPPLSSFEVVEKTSATNDDQTFYVKLKSKQKFTSGDLLAIYPENQQRLYSISKIDNHICLCVKLHENGLGSNFIHNLKEGQCIQCKVLTNHHFHFPKKAKKVLMICNGVGIAPFLGMIAENPNTEIYLFAGFPKQTNSVKKYEEDLKQYPYLRFEFAFSREKNHCYVTDLLKNDPLFWANFLQNKGIVMVCGSVEMSLSVETFFSEMTLKHNNIPFEYYKNNQQWLVDCY